MTSTTPSIWKRHKRKESFTQCPHCNSPIKWIYDGSEWLPCDKEPVLFIMHPQGKLTLIYERKEYSNCLLWKPGDKRMISAPLWAYQQHFYTCPVLTEQRREYVRSFYND